MRPGVAAAAAGDLERWNALIETARAAKEINRTNGLLINRHLTLNQNALKALRGDAMQESFYGPNGQSMAKLGSRNLVIS